MSALIYGRVGNDHRVDMDSLQNRLDEIDDGLVVSSLAATVSVKLRKLADEIDSEVLALSQDRDCSAEFEHRKAEFFESSVAESGKLGVIHHTRRRVGVVHGILGMFFRRAGRGVSGAHGSSSIGAVDVLPPSVSELIVGDASGAPVSPTVAAPDAPSEVVS